MNPIVVLLVMSAAGLAVAFLPTPVILVASPLLLAIALLLLPRGRRSTLLWASAYSLLFGAAAYGLSIHEPPNLALGPLSLGLAGMWLGIQATLRLVAILSLFSLATLAVRLNDLGPWLARRPRMFYLVGTLARLPPQLRDDARRIAEAQTTRGHRFRKGLRGAPTWLALLIPLVVSTMRRARDQTLALRLALPAGPAEPHRWVLVATLASLAIAGRMLLIGLPSISLSFFVVFLAGVAYGPRVGALVGLLSRGATDLLISGLHPVLFAMAPVEGMLGAASGWAGRALNLGQRGRPRPGGAALAAASLGWLYTLAWSVAADTSNWLLFHAAWRDLSPDASSAVWATLVVAGLLFNVPSALFNAALFGTATYPLLRALRAADLLPDAAQAPSIIPDAATVRRAPSSPG